MRQFTNALFARRCIVVTSVQQEGMIQEESKCISLNRFPRVRIAGVLVAKTGFVQEKRFITDWMNVSLRKRYSRKTCLESKKDCIWSQIKKTAWVERRLFWNRRKTISEIEERLSLGSKKNCDWVRRKSVSGFEDRQWHLMEQKFRTVGCRKAKYRGNFEMWTRRRMKTIRRVETIRNEHLDSDIKL